ncbi:hypothetical protein ACHAXT_009292 [Thalassiosira profunda]
MTSDDATPEEDAAAEALYDGIVREAGVESARGNQETLLRGAGAPSSGVATSDVGAAENAREAEEKENTQYRARGVSDGSHDAKQADDEKDSNGKAEGDGASGEGAHATDGPEAKKRKIEGSDETKMQPKPGEAPASPAKLAAATTSVSSPIKARVDIYGRTPGKEPPFPIPCPNCHRSLAASRMASHLEKCLGISTRSTARKASSASGSTGSRGSSGRGKGSGRGGKGGRQGKQAKRKSSR